MACGSVAGRCCTTRFFPSSSHHVLQVPAMSLSREDVQKVSLLARLRLSDDELDQMTAQLGQIIGYVEQLAELDTENVEPMAHAMEVSNVFAEDVVGPSLDRDQILANAPKRGEECYRVPAVLGE